MRQNFWPGLYVCLCVYVCMCVFLCVYMCVVCVCACECVYVCVVLDIYVCICVCYMGVWVRGSMEIPHRSASYQKDQCPFDVKSEYKSQICIPNKSQIFNRRGPLEQNYGIREFWTDKCWVKKQPNSDHTAGSLWNRTHIGLIWPSSWVRCF